MLKLNQIRLTPDRCTTPEQTQETLRSRCAHLLHIASEDIQTLEILRKSLDARKKPQLFYTFSVALSLPEAKERQLLHTKKKMRIPVELYTEKAYRFPEAGTLTLQNRPVIIGTGPAGLFCGYYLALHGYRPLLLERGACIEERAADVERFWSDGSFKPESNVQFGEGGAGTFSDGKLNTLVKDASGRNREVLRCFVENGANPEILYESKPHLGTDVLAEIVRHMRNTILSHGGEVRFHACVTDFQIQDKKLTGVTVNDAETIDAQAVVLAIGHSARDTLQTLYARRVYMEAKAFAVGVRIEHPQEWINEAQYGADCPYEMSAAAYKLTEKSSDGRGVYSFCMCPGGYVVNASSEPHHLAINGMSYAARDGKNANAAMIVTVTPEDYTRFLEEIATEEEKRQLPEALAGVLFARVLERRAYLAGGGRVPVQRFVDFLNRQVTTSIGTVSPQIKGGYQLADVRGIFPKEIGDALAEGITQCGRKIKRFADADVLVEGVESRTSSPVRIPRNERLEASVAGLFPCGEGAGYAGGITSAAMDGLKAAEEIARRYQPF